MLDITVTFGNASLIRFKVRLRTVSPPGSFAINFRLPNLLLEPAARTRALTLTFVDMLLL